MPNKAKTQKDSETKRRSPIVVVMGHVDHGKTTLLDYIRKTNTAAREAGGITQAVGAYEIEVRPKIEPRSRASEASQGAPRQDRDDFSNLVRKITFIDTPGHEAFSAMRARGAQAADLAILVIAADEGVKPQTKEAIAILEGTKTPFIVAINKIDKTGGNVEKAKNDLLAANVFLEGYGGQVSYHGISAKTGEGVDELLDLILLAADLEDLSYDPSAPASGYIVEASRDPRRGSAVSVIIKNGTLRRGEPIHTQSAKGKVKILENFLGKAVDVLEPSAPAVIVGFESLPAVGEEFSVEPVSEKPSTGGAIGRKVWAAVGTQANGLKLILKASDAGSLEALAAVLRGVGEKDKKGIVVVDESVGDVTDGDVKNAIATGAAIVGFKNRIEKGAQNLADAQRVTIVASKIVYELADAVAELLVGIGGAGEAGKLEVLAVFNQEKPERQLVGGRVTEGIMRNRAPFDILRAAAGGTQDVIGSGKILSLREKKTELSEAKEGKEIGLLINSPALAKIGDVLVVRK